MNYSAVQKWWTNYSFHALTARTLMDNILGLCCQMHKGRSIKRYFQSRHCFADSCELEWTIVWRCVVDRTWLVCHTHTTLWAWRVRHACGLGVNSQNSFNKILKSFYLRKFILSELCHVVFIWGKHQNSCSKQQPQFSQRHLTLNRTRSSQQLSCLLIRLLCQSVSYCVSHTINLEGNG